MTKILSIGNSLADNALFFLPQLAAECGGLFLGEMNIGGCSLEKHWNLVRQCELLPEVRPYTFKRTGMESMAATLREALVAEAWDVVSLQQVSTLSFQADSYFPFLQQLHDLVRALAPQAQIVLHQTWAYRVDANELAEYGITQAQMHERLTTAYAMAARKLSLKQLPCGRAFAIAREALGYVPDTAFDKANAQPYALPDQSGSLVIGYFWRTGNTGTGHAELALDGRHGNVMGRYLAGAVWHEMFTGQDVRLNGFAPPEIKAEDLALLRDAAHRAVVEFGGPLTA